ncbi:MAG: MucBP domain-containing protein, partial [Sutterella sp.]
VYSADMAEVTFSYSPSLSELVLHYYDSTLNSLAPNSSLKGYYGEPYKIDPKGNLKGYELVSTSYPLEGTFPPNRQDVDLYFKAAQVTFELVPTNQFGDEIGDKYNIRVTGLMNQTFSERLPEIPGYFAKYSSIEDTIREEYANKRIKINYLPKDSSVTVHSYYKGGNHSGEHVFDDESFAGKVGQNFEYPARTVEGYTPSAKLLSTKFKPEAQDLTIIYNVNTEDYMVHYKDPNDVLVGGMPQATGYYGQAVDVSGSVPRGFHMLSGADSKIYLDGSGVYNVAVNPDELLVDVVPQTADGVSLMAPRQVSGEYHVPQEINVPEIAGFDPVKGSTLTISFELGQTSIPVVYAPQARTITVRYISVEGNEVHEPTIVRGHYQERYRINPLKIDGYFVLKDEPKVGIYGLSDSNVTFVYRAGSDEYSRAVTPLSEIIKQQTSQTEPSDQEDIADFSDADSSQQDNFPISSAGQSSEYAGNLLNNSASSPASAENQKTDSSSALNDEQQVGSDSNNSDDNANGQTEDLLAFLDQLQ